MSRTIPAPLLASTTAAQLNPFFATSLDFDDGSVRYWTGYGTITIGSVTYAGLGAFSAISTIEETEDLAARGLKIDLTGVRTISSRLRWMNPTKAARRRCDLAR